MKNQFYMILPSNSSMNIYKDNTTSCFTTNLPQEINLKGEWEVGLSEIHFPRSFLHLCSDERIIKLKNSYSVLSKDQIRGSVKEIKLEIPYGLFNDVKEVIKYIKTAFTGSHIFFDLSKDHNYTHVSVRLDCKKGECLYEHTVTMSRALLDILGFQDIGEQFTVNYTPLYGTRPANVLNALPKQLFIYTDICEPYIVGDVRASLLRIVPIKYQEYSFGSTQYQIFAPVNYLPLIRNCFRTLIIDIRDHLGRRIPFQCGTSTVTLHFRQVDINL